ncbi:protein B4-like isoform X3 [Sinocyclocheilus anshuiensis]|uniref:protein B4-like isoform X3 n=1 Tax=Sinocyclocheilus anshuiensis TaxID=1608454 RepID=UPI0007B7A76C|nr:PREDICTED: protein B4-like isoform X3 [Sinocyclocheilus anshuiensis]
MPSKKASVEPTAAIPKDSENEFAETKSGSSGKTVARKVSPHPSTMEMVKEALKELDSRKGVSAQAIRGYVKEKYTTVDETRLKFLMRRTLNKGIETGVFVRPTNSGSTTTGAQGRFRIAAKTKAKEAKTQSKENADPNVQKAPKAKKPKATKAEGQEASKEKKSVKKKETTDDAKPEKDGNASKVAPAKKPKAKNAAGEGGTEPKLSKAKASKASKGGAEPAAKKAGKKPAAKAEGDSGEKVAAAATKGPGKRGKK